MAVFKRGGRGILQHEPDVFHRAVAGPESTSDMFGPFPARLISRASDSQSTEADDFETPFLHRADFVGCFKFLQNDIVHRTPWCQSIEPSMRFLSHSTAS